MQRHLVSTCLLALLCATASAQAAQTDGHLSLSLAPGFDSNPLELPETSLKKTEGAFYTELGVDAGLRIKVNRLLSFAMDLTPLVDDPELPVADYVLGFVDRFRADVERRIAAVE